MCLLYFFRYKEIIAQYPWSTSPFMISIFNCRKQHVRSKRNVAVVRCAARYSFIFGGGDATHCYSFFSVQCPMIFAFQHLNYIDHDQICKAILLNSSERVIIDLIFQGLFLFFKSFANAQTSV